MKVVLDTNVLVAASFNPRSNAARIVRAAERGELRVAWNVATLAETRRILEKIPPLDWSAMEGIYRPETRIDLPTTPQAHHKVTDPADREFAALAVAAEATLVSNDDHLLGVREALPIQVMTPAEFVAAHGL